MGTTALNGSAPNLIAASAPFFEQASVFNATVIPEAGELISPECMSIRN
jgi:hypothetical protein